MSPEELRIEAVKVFKEVFDFVNENSIEKSIYTGASDPGEWSPEALLIIHTESGIPDMYDEFGSMKLWDKAEEKLSAIYGKPVYFESINPAVQSLWPV